MSRRRRAENPVSLFPFVAVMASTMAALILLLLVTARQASKARDAAWLEKQRESKTLPPLPPLPGLAQFPELLPLPPHQLPELVNRPLPALPPLTDPRSAIIARRERIEQELAELRKKRERVPKPGEERLAPMMREAALLRDRLQRIVAERRAASAAADKVAATAEEIAAEEKRAEEMRRRSPNKFAVTPYFGPNATERRPIYLECTKDAVVLRPEGVTIPTANLESDARADNSLARMVYAVADHRAKSDREAAYPLLIVRPGGVHSYYVARASLEFLRFPFGYELVADDQQLAYPPADEKVKLLAESAINERKRPSTFAGNGGDGSPGGGGGSGAGHPNAGSNETATNGVVAAVIPREPEPEAAEPAEIGASVRDYIARRHGQGGSAKGLGSLAALAPVPFERPPNGGSAANRRKRERDQARVERDMDRPPPLLSERLQEMVQDAPIALPSARPQTQQWQPGLDGLEQRPSTPESNAAAPTGVWSAAGSRRKQRAPVDESQAPVGAQLQHAANQNGRSNDSERGNFDAGPVRYAEHCIRVEVRAASLVIEGLSPIPLAADDEALAAANAVASKCFKEVNSWADPPTGTQWKPCVLLLVRNGGGENVYRIRAALTSLGMSVKQIWVDDHGVPTLVPDWGN